MAPGVWFARRYPNSPHYNGGAPLMMVGVSQTPGRNHQWTYVKMSWDKWYSVEMDHKVADGSGTFTLTVNGQVVWLVTGTNATEYNNLSLYKSGPWHPSVAPYADVRCLRILNYV